MKSKNLKLSNAFHAVVVTVRLECAEKPSKELQSMLADGLASSKLSELYAALETRHALRTAGLVSDDAAGRSKGVQALATLSAGDGTYRTSSSSKAAGAAFNAGLVLEAVANSGTKSEQSAVLQRLAALLSRAKQHDSALLFLDAPSESDDSLANLRATAAVVTALARFIDAGVALDALTDVCVFSSHRIFYLTCIHTSTGSIIWVCRLFDFNQTREFVGCCCVTCSWFACFI